jgi:hypothetical protein
MQLDRTSLGARGWRQDAHDDDHAALVVEGEPHTPVANA